MGVSENKVSSYLGQAQYALEQALKEVKAGAVLGPDEVEMLSIISTKLTEIRDADIQNSKEAGLALALRWGLTTGRISQIRNRR